MLVLVIALALLAVAPTGAQADAQVNEWSDVTVQGTNSTPLNVAIAVEGGALMIRTTDGTDLTFSRPSSAKPRCFRDGGGVAKCPGITEVGVAGPLESDSVTIDRSVTRAQVSMGGGDDVIKPGRGNTPNDLIEGSEGDDTIDLSGVDHGVTYRTIEIETLIGTAHDDVLRAERNTRWELHNLNRVVGGEGNDVLDLRDGRTTTADCGGDPQDRAILDDSDLAIGCAIIERATPVPPFAAPEALPGADLLDQRWRALGLTASPERLGDTISLELAARGGVAVTAQVALGPWRAGAPWVDLPAVSAGPADGKAPTVIAIPLPPGATEALARDARLRARVRVRFTAPLGDHETREGRFSVVQLPPWRGKVTGRTLRGTFGAQRFVGTPLGDLLTGESADDRLFGMAGSDHLIGGTGNDRLIGGAGDDLSDGLDGDDRHVGGDGNDHLVESRFGDDALDGGNGDDVLIGLRGRDALYGGPGDDILDGGSGPDRMDCGPGEDIAFVNNASDRALLRNCEEIHDGPGVRAFSCIQGGTAEPETLLGTEGNDRCAAGDGADDVEGRGGDDVLNGQGGDDRIFGRFGVDTLRGGDGNDELEGGRGSDKLMGGAGNDSLNGGHDPDVVSGGGGDDRILARGGGADRVDCGAGSDIAYVDSADSVRGCERVSRSGAKLKRIKR
jgi:Ca2+-binding RTX toxin-like protein